MAEPKRLEDLLQVAKDGEVGGGRGGCRSRMVARPFGRECLTLPTMTLSRLRSSEPDVQTSCIRLPRRLRDRHTRCGPLPVAVLASAERVEGVHLAGAIQYRALADGRR
jgi:hypothetical protein